MLPGHPAAPPPRAPAPQRPSAPAPERPRARRARSGLLEAPRNSPQHATTRNYYATTTRNYTQLHATTRNYCKTPPVPVLSAQASREVETEGGRFVPQSVTKGGVGVANPGLGAGNNSSTWVQFTRFTQENNSQLELNIADRRRSYKTFG